MKSYVCITKANDDFEAELIKSKLEDENIPCMTRQNDASGTMPHLRLERGIEILIPEEYEEQAHKALKGHQQ